MPSASDSPALILAVAVLYQCEASQSASISSLLAILDDQPELTKYFSVVIYDNSPQLQSVPPQTRVSVHYVHDPSNGGLAPAYNYALGRAEREGCEWLLLLDQDTSLTADFVSELVQTATALRESPNDSMIVAKLRVDGVIHSPTIPFFQQMRHQFRPSTLPMDEKTVGIAPGPLVAYNSGSTLRVSALRSIGGFPAAFWLDFLDHAIFYAMFDQGFRAWVLRATLQHEASYSDMRNLAFWRMHSVLNAQTLFVKQNGSFRERVLYRIWLLRRGRNFRKSCSDPRIWKETIRHALQLKTQPRIKPDADGKT